MRTAFEWICLIALVIGIAAAAADMRAFCAWALLMSVCFGVASLRQRR